MAIMKMSMEEARNYCDRLDAAKGKANGSAAAPAVAEVVETGPILREPQRPPDGASLQALNDYYARKKRWSEQQRHG
jgi:hypothetical protein